MEGRSVCGCVGVRVIVCGCVNVIVWVSIGVCGWGSLVCRCDCVNACVFNVCTLNM